jgi:hypothetical protein
MFAEGSILRPNRLNWSTIYTAALATAAGSTSDHATFLPARIGTQLASPNAKSAGTVHARFSSTTRSRFRGSR